MKSYLSLIPISAKVRRRQNVMTLLCIVFAVFLVTAVFSMADMGVKMEQTRLLEKHGSLTLQDLLNNTMAQTLFLAAAVLFVLILTAAVLMISSSINSNVAQRTKFFGMMRCLGMSRQQIIRFVRLEALNWCKTAIPVGVALGIVVTWYLCAALRFIVGEEFSNIPLFGISMAGIISGIVVGIVTVLLAAGAPAKRAAKVSPVTAVSGNSQSEGNAHRTVNTHLFKVETALGIHHALSATKNLLLMTGSFALALFYSWVFLYIIVNSISMSVSSRIRSYGAMRAVGMDGHQITKMIAAEAFTYALSGGIVGCAVGLLIYKLLYDILIIAHFSYAVWSLPATLLLIILM